VTELVDVIVCAHNEEATIASVLAAIRGAPHHCATFVVADACSDRTADLAWRAGAVVLPLEARNKGSAMAEGLRHAHTETVAFVDADLRGLEARHVEQLLVSPPRPGMVVGLRDGAPSFLGRLPSISGERRMPRRLAEEAGLEGAGWQAELRIASACQRAGLAWAHFLMDGVRNPRRNKTDEWLRVTGAAVRHAGPLGRMVLSARKVRP
jgi:glycosyltransferase involved in cell wall biosynthesis